MQNDRNGSDMTAGKGRFNEAFMRDLISQLMGGSWVAHNSWEDHLMVEAAIHEYGYYGSVDSLAESLGVETDLFLTTVTAILKSEVFATKDWLEAFRVFNALQAAAQSGLAQAIEAVA